MLEQGPGRTDDSMDSVCWSSPFLEDITMWRRPVLEQFLKSSSLLQGLMLEKLMEDYLPWEELHSGEWENSDEIE